MTREMALTKLLDIVTDESLIRHCMALEAVMSGLARKLGKSPTEQLAWGICGLIHDADWQTCPTEHPRQIVAWLRDQDEHKIADAVAAHGAFWGIPHSTEMSKALVASDELTGFIVSYAKVRPNGINDLTGTQVAKKLRDLRFAMGVDRREVYEGVRVLAVSVEFHAQTIINILKDNAAEPFDSRARQTIAHGPLV